MQVWGEWLHFKVSVTSKPAKWWMTKEKKCANLSAAGYLKIHAHSRHAWIFLSLQDLKTGGSACYLLPVRPTCTVTVCLLPELLIKDLLSTINPQIQLHAHQHISTVHITQGSVIKEHESLSAVHWDKDSDHDQKTLMMMMMMKAMISSFEVNAQIKIF